MNTPEHVLRTWLADCPRPHTLHRHYKGGSYVVTGCCIIEATGQPCVLYRRFPSDDVTKPDIVWCRPLASWQERVEYEGATVPRFAPIG